MARGFYILRQMPMEHHAQEADDDSESEELEIEDEDTI